MALFLGLLAACSRPSSDATRPAGPADGVEPDAVAYFAGGCFWGVEHFLEKLDGVASVESGYMGGHVESPTYEQVTGKKTGHLEAVRVSYDSSIIGYEAIARRFFEIHDPTQTDGQGPDLGPQYLSAVFYASDEERRIAQALIALLEKRGYDVATKLIEADKFWAAEDYHQDYYDKKGGQPYCHRPVDRFGDD